jgi:hypothetical protein
MISGISRRTRILLAGFALAPSSIVLFHMTVQEVRQRAAAEAWVWVGAGLLVKGMLLVGIASLVAGLCLYSWISANDQRPTANDYHD